MNKVFLFFILSFSLFVFSYSNVEAYYYDTGNTNSTYKYELIDPKIPSMQYSTFNWYMYDNTFNLFEKFDKLITVVEESSNDTYNWGTLIYCNFSFVLPDYRAISNIDTSHSVRGCNYFVYDKNTWKGEVYIPIFSIDSYSADKGNGYQDYVRPYLFDISYSNFKGISGEWRYTTEQSSSYVNIFSMTDNEFDDYLNNVFKPQLQEKSYTSKTGGTTLLPYIYYSSEQNLGIFNKYNFDFFVYFSDIPITIKYPHKLDKEICETDSFDSGGRCYDVSHYFVDNNPQDDSVINTLQDLWTWRQFNNELPSDSSGLTNPGKDSNSNNYPDYSDLDADSSFKDDGSVDKYNQAEEDLMGKIDVDTDDLDIDFSNYTHCFSWIWEQVERLLNLNSKLFSLVITVLTFGFVGLVIGR